ncbi:MAG: LCP family protein [Erysipelotrichales bacterium]|nr:LCP family protein [Erysipelotrichales bacterium]
MSESVENAERKAKTRYILAIVFSFVCLGVLIYASWRFYSIFSTFKMLPVKWGEWLLTGLAALCFVLGVFVIWPNIKTMGKLIWGVICLIFSTVLFFGCWYLPQIRSRVEIMFTEVPTEGELEVAFFELKNPETEAADALLENETIDIKSYKDKTIAVVPGLDKENEDYALLYLSRAMDTDHVNTVMMDDLWAAVDSFYNGETDLLMINTSYIPVINNVTEYSVFEERTNQIYSVKKKIQLIDKGTVSDITQEPFTVLIAGTDENGEVTLGGRTDVNILATVNPVTKQVVIATTPRDSWIPNPALAYTNDKLTHMGIFGMQNTMKALSDLYETEVNQYVLVNFDTFTRIIDRIGGITIYNPYGFMADSIPEYQGYFEEGEIFMRWGVEALAYVRERYNLPNGDFDRNMHQQIVLKALIQKLTSLESVSKIDQILEAMEGQFLTTFTIDEIYAFCQMQLDDLAHWNIQTYSVTGGFGMEYCAAMGYTDKLSIVYPNYEDVQKVRDAIDRCEAGEILSEE